MKFKAFIFLLVVACGQMYASSKHLIVAVAPEIPDSFRDLVAIATSELLFGCEAGTRVTVVRSEPFAVLADVVVPDGAMKLRQQRVRSQVTQTLFGIQAATNDAGIFSVPALVDNIARQLGATNASVIIIGPSLHRDGRQPYFDFVNGWPSDAHLSADRARSPFSTIEQAHLLRGITFHWVVTDDSAVKNANHAKGVRRFWALYLAAQDGTLISYSADIPSGFANAIGNRTKPLLEVTADPTDTNVVMKLASTEMVKAEPKPHPIVITKVVTITNTVTHTNYVRLVSETVLPRVAAGNTGIGIVWFPTPGIWGRIDLDLYVPMAMDRTELWFGHTNSLHGKYFRDIQQSSETGSGDWRALWEFVEIQGDNLPEEVWINIYAGSGPVQGELRIQHRGEEHRVAFTMPAVKGNMGDERQQRNRSQHWLRIDLRSFR